MYLLNKNNQQVKKIETDFDVKIKYTKDNYLIFGTEEKIKKAA